MDVKATNVAKQYLDGDKKVTQSTREETVFARAHDAIKRFVAAPKQHEHGDEFFHARHEPNEVSPERLGSALEGVGTRNRMPTSP